jgi:transcriptional regulator with XRE-family HTH domain
MRKPDLAKLTSYDPDPLLAAVIERLNVKNDAELARALAISAPVISKIRHRKMVVSANLLLRIHEITSLRIKELRVLMGNRRPVFS